jgi:hypothetical protein
LTEERVDFLGRSQRLGSLPDEEHTKTEMM